MTANALGDVIQQARNKARAILDELERVGAPNTNESSGLYLGLVTIQKRLAAQVTAGTVAEIATELQQLAGLCTGKLEAVKPFLDEALRITQARPSGRR